MQTLKSFAAIFLSTLLVTGSIPTNSYSSPLPSSFAMSIPSSLGYISSTYSPTPSVNAQPDVILIQDLHANRSVQFSISGILKRLKAQGLVPSSIAVEGETGPVDIKSMQDYPDATIRKAAADYLVQQGELTGPMHYAVTEGAGQLVGIETDSYYKANLEMFRRSYQGRSALRTEIKKVKDVLPQLQKDATTRDNAAVLEKEIGAVNRLLNNEVIPDELPATLGQANAAIDHLKLVLPQEKSNQLVEPIAASVNFYALALVRNEELFKNALAIRQQSRQKTTIAITGGFHTDALAEQCKRHGLSYAVITPTFSRHTKVDEELYISSLFDKHLTPEQVETGDDWTALKAAFAADPAMGTVQGKFIPKILGPAAIRAAFKGVIPGLRLTFPSFKRTAQVTFLAGACVVLASCHGTSTSPGGDDPNAVHPPPRTSEFFTTGSPAQTASVNGMYVAWGGQSGTPLSTLSFGMYLEIHFTQQSAKARFFQMVGPMGVDQDPSNPSSVGLNNGLLGLVPFKDQDPNYQPVLTISVNPDDFHLTSAQLAKPEFLFLISGSNAFGTAIPDAFSGQTQPPTTHADFTIVNKLTPTAALRNFEEQRGLIKTWLASLTGQDKKIALQELARTESSIVLVKEQILAEELGRPIETGRNASVILSPPTSIMQLQTSGLSAAAASIAPGVKPIAAARALPVGQFITPARAVDIIPPTASQHINTPYEDVLKREFPRVSLLERLGLFNPSRVRSASIAQRFTRTAGITGLALAILIIPSISFGATTLQIENSTASLGHGAFYTGLGIYGAYAMIAVVGIFGFFSRRTGENLDRVKRLAEVRSGLIQFTLQARATAADIAARFSGPLAWIPNVDARRRTRKQLVEMSSRVLTAA